MFYINQYLWIKSFKIFYNYIKIFYTNNSSINYYSNFKYILYNIIYILYNYKYILYNYKYILYNYIDYIWNKNYKIIRINSLIDVNAKLIKDFKFINDYLLHNTKQYQEVFNPQLYNIIKKIKINNNYFDEVTRYYLIKHQNIKYI